MIGKRDTSFHSQNVISLSRIEKIEGNVLTLRDTANRTVSDPVICHNDTAAIKEAIDRALRKKFNICFPVGHYNWNIHDNTFIDCLRPLVLNSYGSRTSLFKSNLVTRGSTDKVYLGVEVHGCFQFLDNHLTGFDEQGSAALALYPDAIGRTNKSLYQGNIFRNCFDVVTESKPGLWMNSMTKDNITIECARKIPG